MDANTSVVAIPPSEFEINLKFPIPKNVLFFSFHRQNYINSILNDTNGTVNELLPGWIPENMKRHRGKRVQVKLLCGADLLESFAVPGLWNDDDVSCAEQEPCKPISNNIFDFIFAVGSNSGRTWTCRYHKKWIESREIYF